MIKSIKIKCPLCDEESELFLSMNPTVIVLNCPECWTPLMYDKNKIRILSEHELHTIAEPSTESVIDNFFDNLPKREAIIDHHSAFENSMPLLKKKSKHHLLLKTTKKVHRNHITTDDIIDLRIELEQCKDIQEFIDKM